jgi:choline dehydrogenase-like flavoprotein
MFPPAYLTRASTEHAAPLYAAACVQWTGAAMLARSVLKRTPGRLRSIGFNVFGTMAPERSNFVAPDRASRDGSGLVVNITHPPESTKVLEEARDQLIELLSRAGLSPASRLWKVEAPGVSVHLAGTCRMHDSPDFGMLDRWGRLHAVANVMVADSSAFTTGPEKNPVLTAMTLAARASDRLVHDLHRGAC